MRKSEIDAIKERQNKVNFLLKLGYSEDEANKYKLKISSPNSYLYWMYKGHSKDESIKIVSDLQKVKSPRCKEYWVKKGYSESDSIRMVSKYQDNVSFKEGDDIESYKKKCDNRKINKDKYISLYGEEEGINRWLNKKERSKITRENMVRVYGDEEGEKRWVSYIEKQKYSQSIEGLILKHGTEKANQIFDKRKSLSFLCKRKYIETGNHQFLNNSYSKSSQELFWSIYSKLENELKSKCYFKELNHEYALVDNESCYLYDFVISNINLCIEFNGDLWHANPIKYKSDDLIFNKKASDIWNHDFNKIELLKNKRNINTIVIWESDWKSDKLKIENEIFEKINIYHDTIN